MEIFKTICSLLFLSIAISSHRISPHNKKYFYLIFIGLVFSSLGDVFLAFNIGWNLFYYGFICFVLSHIFFIFGFSYLKGISKWDFGLFLIIFTPSIIFLLNKKGFNYQEMQLIVCLYAIIITFMLCKALSLFKIRKDNPIGTTLVILGTIFFFISDYILVFVIYYNNCSPYMGTLNLIIYYLGQGFLALSFIKSFKKK
ncbi:lysoplasmalogenase family protein [Clostridium sp. LP20]|uniref:lysoplasmalogenase family protein n=1 Tax=Clostridium sp. LP20 TaxID=3418665 RepID=UPI003EE53E46